MLNVFYLKKLKDKQKMFADIVGWYLLFYRKSYFTLSKIVFNKESHDIFIFIFIFCYGY